MMNITDSGEKQSEKGIVYLAKNNVNGKLYVGITTRLLHKRIAEHRYDSTDKTSKPFSYFHKAIYKYGFDNFTFETLETVIADTKENLIKTLYLKEQVYISMLNTHNRDIGYNLTDGGDGINGYKMTDRQRQAVGNRHRGKHLSHEHRMKISVFMRSDKNPNRGKHLTDDAKCKISMANKGRLAGKNNPMYGKKRPDLTQRNLASGYKVLQIDKDTLKVIRAWNSLREITRETGYTRSCIADCCNHKSKISYGYLWEYEQNYVEKMEEENNGKSK